MCHSGTTLSSAQCLCLVILILVVYCLHVSSVLLRDANSTFQIALSSAAAISAIAGERGQPPAPCNKDALTVFGGQLHPLPQRKVRRLQKPRVLAQHTKRTSPPVSRAGRGVPLGVQADPERDEVLDVPEDIAVVQGTSAGRHRAVLEDRRRI